MMEKQEFPHVVTIKPKAGVLVVTNALRMDDARKWCRQQVQKGNWQTREGWDYTEFKFVDSKDATMFALRWS